MTGYAIAARAPERLTRLVAGAFDPIGGFRSAADQAIQTLGLPVDVSADVLCHVLPFLAAGI